MSGLPGFKQFFKGDILTPDDEGYTQAIARSRIPTYFVLKVFTGPLLYYVPQNSLGRVDNIRDFLLGFHTSLSAWMAMVVVRCLELSGGVNTICQKLS